MSTRAAKTAINRSQNFSLADKRTLREVIDQITVASTVADANEAHALNAVFSDTEVEAALNALAVKINAILAILRAS